MTRTAAEIEREVEETRAGLDETVEALKSKMSPGQLIDELGQSLKGAGAGDLFGNLGKQVKDNPLALAMVGAGVAWLMIGQGSGGSQSVSSPHLKTDSEPHTADLNSGARETETGVAALGGMKDKAVDLAQAAASHVSEATAHLKDGVTASADGAVHAAQSVGKGAAEVGQKVQRTFMDTLEREPLIIAALGIAVGAAIGASLPATRLEDDTIGAARDSVAEKATSIAHDGIDQARDAAEAALVGARDAAHESGLIGAENGSLADKAETVIRAGVEAAKEQVASHDQQA